VRLREQGVRLGDLASPAPSRTAGPLAAVAGFVRKTMAIAEIEARKLRHDPSELLVRAVQPALWLLVFGQVFTRVRASPPAMCPTSTLSTTVA
jgi:ABC-2 type transport system permease protein